MKVFIFLVIYGLSFFVGAATVPVSLKEVTTKVSGQNFTVLETAERVYQKKESIKLARANLLPKLNLWNIVKVAADWVSVLDLVQDIAPFLVPANWFQAKQSKLQYRLAQHQYRALWANEVNTAKLLFLGVVRDERLLKMIRAKTAHYMTLMEMARARNIFGGDDSFSYNLIRQKYLSLREDERLVSNLIFQQKKELQYLMAIDNDLQIQLVEPNLPAIEASDFVDYEKVAFKVLEASPELAQYKYLMSSLANIKKQIYFNVLGTSTFSLGQGAGAFDNIPIQDGLGFGLGPSLRIAKTEKRILKIQIKAVVETLKQQTQVLVNEYNSIISNYDIVKERIILGQENFSQMMSYLRIGGRVSGLEMMKILDDMYASKLILLAYQYRFASLVEKLKRMTFSGDYLAGPSYRAGGSNE